MRPTKDLRKRIKEVPLSTNAEKDKEVLADVLNALEESRTTQSAAHRPSIWRFIMKNNITRLAAAVFVIAAVVGVAQLDGTRAAFAGTARVVATGLAGLKEFIRDIRTREPQPPSAVVPADLGKQEAVFEGRSILANVRTISVEGDQNGLQDFFEKEGIELAPAGNAANTWYAKLDPGRTERFIGLIQAVPGFKLLSLPSLMVKEGQEAIIGIAGAGEPDATALALVATVPDDDESIDLSFSFLQGQSGFEIPSLRIDTDDAVLFRLVTTGKRNSQDGPGGQDCILVLVKTKVFPPS
jgi:hypothetical protein